MRNSQQNNKTQNILNLLNEYSFNKQNIESIFYKYTEHSKIKISKEKNKQQKQKIVNNNNNEGFIIPEENDSVFWCWLIFTKGLSNYTISRDRVFVTEKTEKINFIEKVRINKK